MACTYPFQCQRPETACSGVTLWKRPWRVSRMERAGELFIWGKAEGSGLVHPEEDMASGITMAALQVPWGCYGVDGARLFTVVQGRRMWDKRHKLKEGSCRVDIRKWFFLLGETGSGTGCSESLCGLCPWRFSGCYWTEPEATQSDLRDKPVVSRRVERRPFQPEMLCDCNYHLLLPYLWQWAPVTGLRKREDCHASKC